MDAITQFLTDQGLWGISVLFLGLSTKLLYTENKDLREAHAKELREQQTEHEQTLQTERERFHSILEDKEAALLGEREKRLEEREKRVEEQKAATRAVGESNVALKETLDRLLAMKHSITERPNSGRG